MAKGGAGGGGGGGGGRRRQLSAARGPTGLSPRIQGGITGGHSQGVLDLVQAALRREDRQHTVVRGFARGHFDKKRFETSRYIWGSAKLKARATQIKSENPFFLFLAVLLRGCVLVRVNRVTRPFDKVFTLSARYLNLGRIGNSTILLLFGRLVDPVSS